MRDVRLALIMGGGVSLGTYTAGALTELYHALGEVNRSGAAQVRVEVLVGASAGSMTAALFAKALICDAPEVTVLMHDSWVNDIDISKLAPPDTTVFDPLSLLLSKVIDDIGATSLVPPSPTAPWSYATDTIHLGFTGTNLGGIPLAMSYRDRAGEMVFDDHADAFIYTLNKTDQPAAVAQNWDLIRRAAIASGSFPLAFPPQQIPRNLNDPAFQDLEFLSFPRGTSDPLGMWYCDGGVFDNEPIGLAKRLVAQCADSQNPAVEYRYIVIDHDLARNTWTPFQNPASLVSALGGVVGAVLEQGTSKDYLRATKVNEHANSQRVAAKGQLLPLVLAVDPASLPMVSAQLAKTLDQAIAIHFFDASDEPQAAQIARIVQQQRARIDISTDYSAVFVGLDAGRRAALIDAVLVSEVTAGLLDKRLLDINIIAPNPPANPDDQVLAGAFLWNFGGFFDQAWRQHDFDCGRRDARFTLGTDLEFEYAADPSADYAPAQVLAGVANVSPQKRADLLAYLTKRIEALVRPALDDLASDFSWPKSAIARTIIPRIPAKVAELAMKKIGLG
jgi:predicted acylesterase/phospholipase RssA